MVAMFSFKVALWLSATLYGLGQQQSFVSAQNLDRLANGFIVEFANSPIDLDPVSIYDFFYQKGSHTTNYPLLT